jgi:predicted Fe-S protein YdhL (DUF1289 family)
LLEKENNQMKTFFKSGLIFAGLLGAICSFVHPYGPVKGLKSDRPLLDDAAINSAIAQVLERSCQNCHSERTEWPWYSYVAPVSWLVEKDVKNGRSHLDMSRWEAYTPDEQVEILTKLGVEVRNRRMPLPQYVRLHPDAKLSDEDVQQLYAWVHGERRRLKTLVASRSKVGSD